MTVTDQQARAIAFLAAASRPTGATRWDEAGIVANLAKVKDRNLATVVIAVMQAAEDRKAQSPGVIPTAGPHWRAPEAGAAAAILNTFDPTSHCGVCNKANDGRHPADHDFVSAMDERRTKADAEKVAAAIEYARSGIGDAKAENEPEKPREPLPALPEVDRLRELARQKLADTPRELEPTDEEGDAA